MTTSYRTHSENREMSCEELIMLVSQAKKEGRTLPDWYIVKLNKEIDKKRREIRQSYEKRRKENDPYYKSKEYYRNKEYYKSLVKLAAKEKNRRVMIYPLPANVRIDGRRYSWALVNKHSMISWISGATRYTGDPHKAEYVPPGMGIIYLIPWLIYLVMVYLGLMIIRRLEKRQELEIEAIAEKTALAAKESGKLKERILSYLAAKAVNFKEVHRKYPEEEER